MPLTHVSNIVLGDSQEERIELATGVLRLGFPEGVIAWCPACNTVDHFTLTQAAERIATRTWPNCHGRSMLMEDPDSGPQY